MSVPSWRHLASERQKSGRWQLRFIIGERVIRTCTLAYGPPDEATIAQVGALMAAEGLPPKLRYDG